MIRTCTHTCMKPERFIFEFININIVVHFNFSIFVIFFTLHFKICCSYKKDILFIFRLFVSSIYLKTLFKKIKNKNDHQNNFRN